MRSFCCITCRHVWQLGGDIQEIHHLLNSLDIEKGSYKCITPHCNGRLALVHGGTPHGYTPKEIPIRAFYRAIHGFGSGEGKEASVERFTELLRTKRIVEVQAIPVGQPERVILRQLVLDDGTRLHFDSSSRGACCYYIEEHGPSCLEVVEDELSVDATNEVSNPDRKEVGRDPQTESTDNVGGVNGSSSAASEQSSAGGVPSVSETDSVQTSSDSGDGSTGTGSNVRL